MSEIDGSVLEDLHAYHDGELSGFARWRLERRLARSPELQRELAELTRLSELVRASRAGARGPDLWDRIALRLPAEDARRAESREPSGGAWAWWRPVSAVAAVGALAFALYLGIPRHPAAPGGAVRWMDSGGHSVLVLDDAEAEVTIIWRLEDPLEGAVRGERSDVV